MLSKKYTNPSSDIITVLTGLDQVDGIFQDFANAIEGIIRNGRSRESPVATWHLTLTERPVQQREKAVRAALSLTTGAYQTSLVSYFTHKDLFPALMKVSLESGLPDLS